jgi:glycosyltransferase involved in cell wall biosynthesis
LRLLILHQAWLFGGAERTTANLLRHLDRTVVQHITLAAPVALRDLLPSDYDAYVNTGPLMPHGWFLSPQAFAEDVVKAAGVLREARPDVVLGMMHYSAALATFGARQAGLPMKTVASFRGPLSEYIRRHERGLRRKLFLRVSIARTARRADRIIVPSRGTAWDTRVRFFGPGDRIDVIPNGIDADAVRALAAEPAPGLEQLRATGLPLLCVAARLSVEKDVSLLVEAVHRVQASHPCALAIVGDGPERAALEQRVAQLGLSERVAFIGHRANAYPYMRAADIYVHTCQFEGFGYTMAEAMACGTPVIATDCPHGPREVLDEGKYGVLVRPGDVAALAEGLAALLADPGRRQELTELGLARAEQLSVQAMAASYQTVFQALARH